MADPPSDAGAVQLMVAWPAPGFADGEVGAPGTVPRGVTVAATEADPDPSAEVADTAAV
jgi:hypothetical protein